MKLVRFARRLYENDRMLQLALLLFMLLYFGVILDDAGFRALRWLPQNLTFNSMLDHLLRGQFDVDPRTIGDEGFVRDGHVYSYFGIWCALVRLPLRVLHLMKVDFTPWSCLLAVCLATMAKIRTVLFLRKQSSSIPASTRPASTRAKDWAYGLMLLYVVLGGSAVAYLRASIYQEVVFWAVAFGAVFIYFSIKGIVLRQYSVNTLSWMALVAGLALLTRVSTGLGLYLAFGLLMLVLVGQDVRGGSKEHMSQGSALRRAILSRRTLVPVAILALLVVATGTVNFFRWGNPATFVNYKLHLMNGYYPDRPVRARLYGFFNVSRIPFGLMYYFVPIWFLHNGSGHLLFESTQVRLFDAVELPPSSFFLTDLLPIGFIAFLAYALKTGRSKVLQPVSRWLALAAGLVVPCVLMLSAIYMSYRYRMEFYPLIDLLAFLGLYAVVSDEGLLASFSRCRGWMLSATLVSVIASFAILVLYELSDFGPSRQHLQGVIVHYYVDVVRDISM
jgi:hypothetical protein